MEKMLYIFATAFNAVVPVVLVVVLGYCLRKYGILTKEFVLVGNKVGFQVAIPCMVFLNVYNIESFQNIQWEVVIYTTVILLVIFILGLVSTVIVTKVPERRGVLLQCTFRSNMAILGLSLASSLGGEEAVAVAAVVSAFSLPVMNILAVLSLSIFVDQKKSSANQILRVLKNIAQNPLIVGIGIGMICLLLRGLQQTLWGWVVISLERDFKFIYLTLNYMKSMASPFALLVLGAQFDFSSSKGMMKEIVFGTAWRIILAPLIGIGTAVMLSNFTPILNFGVNEYPALVALFGTPTAVSSAIMAGQMHNDEQLATQLVVWSSIISIGTMFLTVLLMMACGLLAA